MSQPTIYQVKPEQIGSSDLLEFLRNAVAKQFQNKEYYVSKELVENKVTHYSQGKPRRLIGFCINEANASGHVIYFDVTDCPGGTTNWSGR